VAPSSQRLDPLEKSSIVVRTVVNIIPPRTRYGLTTTGRGLKMLLESIGKRPVTRRWRFDHASKHPRSASVCLGLPRSASVCLGLPRSASVCLGRYTGLIL